MIDEEIEALIAAETKRQTDGLEMIPSENHTSQAVLDALGSRLTDKYSEGYPGKRYYGGCEVVDKVENLARDRAKALFGVDHANVQPYSGSPANQAIYFALVNPGDTVMGMHLYYGGHMTHGLKVNFSGTYYNSVQYKTGKDGYLDYEAMAAQVEAEKPKLLFVGATAYPRIFDWQKLREIADLSNAWLVADTSHITGLIVAGEHPSPVGPHNHQTAAIAVALREAATPEFKAYGQQIVKNAKKLAAQLTGKGYQLVTGGTDNHLLLIDLTNKKLSGAEAERALGKAGITVNKNTVPYDPRSPFDPSGIRLGTPALTTRGMKEAEMDQVAEWIDQAITNQNDDTKLAKIQTEVHEFTKAFPLPTAR